MWLQPDVIDGQIGSQSIQKKCGIQATFAKKLTRQSLWNAMLRRTTYGTTGARIIILFTVNGVEMGNSTTIAPEQQPVIRACIGGTAAFQEITLYRYRKEQWTTPYVETDTGTQFRDFEFSDTEAEAPAIYYLRVRQVDGELAWSSPVWIDTES